MTGLIPLDRKSPLRTALRLEITTIIWMVIEAVAAVGAGIAAGSLLLVAFGIDSVIELTSAIVIFRRFRFELSEKFDGDLHRVSDVERKTARIGGYLLFLLLLTLSCKRSLAWSHDVQLRLHRLVSRSQSFRPLGCRFWQERNCESLTRSTAAHFGPMRWRHSLAVI